LLNSYIAFLAFSGNAFTGNSFSICIVIANLSLNVYLKN